jgi:hypothetical protein
MSSLRVLIFKTFVANFSCVLLAAACAQSGQFLAGGRSSVFGFIPLTPQLSAVELLFHARSLSSFIRHVRFEIIRGFVLHPSPAEQYILRMRSN